MEQRKISRAVISRLPRYYRYLGDLLEAGVERISSNDLSKKMQVTASQIRQDLNNFGGFGQQGYGYNVKYLYTEIGKILGLDKDHNFIIIGAGNLGQALANYASFERNGFILKSLFDVNPRLEGVTIRGIPVRMLDELEGYLQEDCSSYTSQVKSGGSSGCPGSEWDQGHLEFCTYGSYTSQGCHCGECTSC